MIPCIDLEFVSLNMKIEIQFLTPITFCRYKNIEKGFVIENDFLIFLEHITFEPKSDLLGLSM